MTHIYFVRHAKPNLENHDDRSRELSAEGLEDRLMVTAYLADKPVDAVFSSPYRRAMDTVQDYADRFGHPVVPVEDFRERRVGDGWLADFDAFARAQWRDFGYHLEGGESLSQVQARSIRALERLLAEYPEKTLVIGSHGTALCTVIQYYRKDFQYADFARIQGLMPWIVHFVFSGNTCVSISEYNPFTKITAGIYP